MPRVRMNSQGEARLRLLRVVRKGDWDDPHDLTIAVRVEAARAAAGEAPPVPVVPGETLKSFVHQVLRQQRDVELEALAMALSQRVLDAGARISLVRVEVGERPWRRLDIGARAQGQAFALGSSELRTVVVTTNGSMTSVVSGLENLTVMRTSGFVPRRSGVRADDGSEDALPSLVVGNLSARWTHGSVEVICPPHAHGVRAAILETFALHAGRSIQQTLHAIGEAILSAYEGILDVTLSLREGSWRPADPLRPALDTPDDLFVLMDEPVAVAEIVVERSPVDGGT